MVNLADLIPRMSRLEHFKNLSYSELKTIIEIGQIHRFAAGTRIFLEGDSCSGLYVLLSGQVHLYKNGPQGQENIIAVIKPVIMFNEVAVLDGGTNPVTAVPFKDSTIWRANSERFNLIMERYPKIALGLLPILAARNRWLISQYEDLSFLSVRARMAKLLLELSDFGGSSINRREYSINDMAARVATVAEAVSRTLSLFRENGWVTSSRTEIVVIQTEELAGLAQLDTDFVLSG
jgi:CRP/FNR family transcriptional regulator